MRNFARGVGHFINENKLNTLIEEHEKEYQKEVLV
jgi:hypothetical protein